jgi:hypothetical protein
MCRTNYASVIRCVRTTQIRYETEIDFDFLYFFGFRWSTGVLGFLSSILVLEAGAHVFEFPCYTFGVVFFLFFWGLRFFQAMCRRVAVAVFSGDYLLFGGAGCSSVTHDRLEKRVIAGVNGCLSDLTVGGVFILHIRDWNGFPSRFSGTISILPKMLLQANLNRQLGTCHDFEGLLTC